MQSGDLDGGSRCMCMYTCIVEPGMEQYKNGDYLSNTTSQFIILQCSEARFNYQGIASKTIIYS